MCCLPGQSSCCYLAGAAAYLDSLPGQSSCCYLAGAAFFPLQLTWPIIMLLFGRRSFLPSPAYLANHHAATRLAQLPSFSNGERRRTAWPEESRASTGLVEICQGAKKVKYKLKNKTIKKSGQTVQANVLTSIPSSIALISYIWIRHKITS